MSKQIHRISKTFMVPAKATEQGREPESIKFNYPVEIATAYKAGRCIGTRNIWV